MAADCMAAPAPLQEGEVLFLSQVEFHAARSGKKAQVASEERVNAILETEIERKRLEFQRDSEPQLLPGSIQSAISTLRGERRAPRCLHDPFASPSSTASSTPAGYGKWRSTRVMVHLIPKPCMGMTVVASPRARHPAGILRACKAVRRRLQSDMKVVRRVPQQLKPGRLYLDSLEWERKMRSMKAQEVEWMTAPSGAVLSGREAIEHRRAANPLHKHLGEASEMGFHAFIVERELIRIRRHELNWPCEAWPSNYILGAFRFTNVKRSEDRTTKQVKQVLAQDFDPLFKSGWGDHPAPSSAWPPLPLLLAGDLILCIALWRGFGTPLAIRTIGFRRFGTQPHEWELSVSEVARHLVEAAFAEFQSDPAAEAVCFTKAYFPPRRIVATELALLRRGDRAGLAKLYANRMADFSGICSARGELGRSVAGGAMSVLKSLMCINGFAGTGFTAKEIVEDLKMSAAFTHSMADQFPNYALCGPGARRGLNRLAGLPVDKDVTTSCPMVQLRFLDRLRSIRNNCLDQWPKIMSQLGEGKDAAVLRGQNIGSDFTANDIQFMLCEFDKFLRAVEAAKSPAEKGHSVVHLTRKASGNVGLRRFRAHVAPRALCKAPPVREVHSQPDEPRDEDFQELRSHESEDGESLSDHCFSMAGLKRRRVASDEELNEIDLMSDDELCN